ncbi:polyphosphate kinase 1 [Pseudobdellovibrio exovorus]|uniref:Polyphosphate kinase n=1 Tax=Pseudobdellovibrio exovorus JSS TaxID=1184267 RepID=M4V6P1_9BACT|nr:polyphosphate kinase 1 [Pseudobdellovibrio exovorus]AGH95027.1 polyphosphate kinase [Pseudobdellovibrio exovorus JSS]
MVKASSKRAKTRQNETLAKTRSKKSIRKKKKIRVVEHTRSSALIFSNRELGWLNFNLRVLAEAEDPQNPLLERLNFLSISSSNLDEFFMKRVGGLKRHVAYGVSAKSSDGQTPEMQLAMIKKKIPAMFKKQKVLSEDLKKLLRHEGANIVSYSDLKDSERKFVRDFFNLNIFPILTPLSVDPGHPFPFISNLSSSLGVALLNPNNDEEKLFARVKIPRVINQWIFVEGTNKIVHLVDVIRAHLPDLFPSMKVVGSVLFRVSRNADSDREEEDAEDLLAMIEEELRQRRFAEIVRLEFGHCSDPWLKEFLMSQLELKEDDLYPMQQEFDLTDFSLLASSLNWPKHKFPTWSPVVPTALTDPAITIFDAIKKQDILLHHPFESFSASVERLIRDASLDPDVLAIKMTLYRTGDNSPFVKALIEAAELGKQVVCLVELKARFDEERNIYWAQELENAGVHVVYGVVGLKTHAKTALIVRKESDRVRCYAHLGTGNYNSSTSRFYTDLGLLTCDERITNELVEFFNYLTGKSLKQDYQHLILAPLNMFSKMKEYIQREREHAIAGRPALIMAKFNNMEENDISLALYEASQSNVPIHLIVRGFCCIKPHMKGISETLQVQSTLGRFLEHSRVFYFRNGHEDPLDGDFFIASADWMYRNLHARVESMSPIYDRTAKEKLWSILQMYWNDKKQSWTMKSDATYERKRKAGDASVGVQNELMRLAASPLNFTEDDLIKEEKE